MSDERIRQRAAAELQKLESLGRRRQVRTVRSLPCGLCSVNGRTVVNFASNDYLGLAHELPDSCPPDSTKQLGATASALVAGYSPEHAALEKAIAEFEDTDSALLFPAGYAANLGLLTGLVQEGDAVFCDRDNHASLIDAARLCRGKMQIYRRTRLASLEETLKRRRGQFNHVFMVTDGVFSMDGTIAPLRDLCSLAERFDASVLVDEAHGTGVLGKRGRGVCEYLDVESRVLARVGTMSKAMGGLGGFVVSSNEIVELLRNTARTQFFSTALPVSVCSAMLQALKIIRSQPERRMQLTHLRTRLQIRMDEFGLPTIGGGLAPIVPIIVPGEGRVMKLSDALLNEGFLVPAIRFPTVKQGTERLRLSFGAAHSTESVDDVVRCIAAIAG